MTCDNISSCHTPITQSEDENAHKVICKTCKESYIIRKDSRGIHENRQYSKIFKKDILQGHDNLLYKYREDFLKT